METNDADGARPSLSEAVDPSLSDLARAYADVEDGAPPAQWTPAQVNIRLLEAFTVVIKTAGRVGPKQFGSNWPAILLEFEDYLGYDHVRYMEDRRVEIARDAARKFSSLEIARADEAINWASRYLADEPVLADAIQLWAWCKARGVKIERVLRARRRAADKLRSIRGKEDDNARNLAVQARRRKIAAGYAAWANERLLGAPDAAYAARIRAGARELARKAILEAERATPRPSTAIRRSEVMPGRVFTRAYLDDRRAVAARILAERLQQDGMVVR